VKGLTRNKNNVIAAVDVGTSKISCLIGEINGDESIEILGKGAIPSHGIKKGAIADIQESAKAIELAVIEAENATGIPGIRVNSVFAGVSGEFISSSAIKGKIDITGKNFEITPADVKKVISTASSAKVGEQHRALHVIPRGYFIDGHNGIKNPVGMVGKQLEVDAYLIAGENTFLENITRTFNRSGLELETSDYFYSSLASAHAVVDESEKNLGIVLIDIGAGTTKVNIYKSGVLLHSWVMPLGGDNITYDIAMTFKIPLSEAESLKITKGSASPELLTAQEEEEEVEAISFSESESVNIQRRMLSEIIEARLMDIFEGIHRDLLRLNNMGICIAGAVLTGGCAKLRHINHISQRVLEIPTKIGRTANMAGLGTWAGNPEFASVIGILQMAADKRSQAEEKARPGTLWGFLNKIYQWLLGVF
jgi:cell division protein FtsA